MTASSPSLAHPPGWNRSLPRVAHGALAALVVCLPGLATLLLLRLFLGASVTDFVPATDDEMFLWRQEVTFAEAGLDGGFYTYEEQRAAFSLSHFGAHGVAFPLLFGTLGRLIGWTPYTGIILNLIVVTLALAMMVLTSRPNTRQLALLALLLLTFWPLFWALTANSQEALNLALAILFAILLASWLKGERLVTVGNRALFTLGVMAVGLARPFWTLLLIPVAALTPGYRRRPLYWLVALGAIAVTFLAVVYTSAPFPNFLRDLLQTISKAPANVAGLFFSHLRGNVLQFFPLDENNPLFFLARFQVLFLLLVFVALVALAIWRKRSQFSDREGSNRQNLFHSLNLGLLLATVVLFYIPNGDPGFRLYTPYILLTAILLVAYGRYWLVVLLIAAHLAAAPLFFSELKAKRERHFSFAPNEVAAFRQATEPFLEYDSSASPWENTLLIDGGLLCYRVRCDYLTAVPPGMGISVIFFPERLQAPLKSKYLLLDDEGRQRLVARLGDRLHLRLLTPTAYGDLYLNLDAAATP
jgi:hypothetical protein